MNFLTLSPAWVVVLPPLLVLTVATITRNVIHALICGILAAAIIAPNSSITLFHHGITAFHLILQHLIREIGNLDHLYTFGFLLSLGILIEYMTHTGGIERYAQLVQRYIRTKRQAETVPLALGPLFFLDDYLNNLVGGSIVRPLFDRFHLARAKLAYILNAMSSSQCLLIPISSWIAVIVTQLQSAGVSCSGTTALVTADAYTLYTGTIPYMLYPIISIASAWFIVRREISYGPMYTEEKTASAQPVKYTSSSPHATVPLSNFLIPLVTFIGGIPLALLWRAGWNPLSGETTWCSALQRIDLLLEVLWWSSIGAVIVSTIFFLATRRLSPARTGTLLWSGICMMKNSLLLLTLAWTFGTLLQEHLHTGNYIAQLIIAQAPQAIVPVVCFITATFITASIGSSWGMMSIMIPLIIPIITVLHQVSTPVNPDALYLLLPSLGAIFSGAAAGPHFSPITDAAIISSATAGIPTIDHIRTMIPYALPALVSTIIGYIILAFVPHSAISISSVLIGCILFSCATYTYRTKK